MTDLLQEAKAAFIRAGGHLQHKRVVNRLTEADNRARIEADKIAAPPNKEAATWIVWALGWLAVIFFCIVLIGGTAALLVIVPVAEFAAVYEGLHLITPTGAIAVLTTAALFVGTIVLIFFKNVYEDALPNGKPLTGVRRWAGSVGRFIGHRKLEALDTDAQLTLTETRYLMLNRALGFAKASILFASLIGRLKTSIQAHAGQPVGQALESIRSTLTGQELIGAIVSLIVLFALLRLLDVGVLFAYSAFKNTAGKLDLAEAKPVDFLETYSALSDSYQAEALNDMTLELSIRSETSDS